MGNIIRGQFRNCPDSREVETKYGVVKGRRLIHEGDKLVDAFQGIPFAKPPVGELRFKLPEPPEPWEGVKETKAFAPRGIQKDSVTQKFRTNPTSEDNLYLNVFTPVWNPPFTSGFPVLVFIHGGGYVGDSAVKYGDIGICRHLCSKDMVVVTLQYRLGFLGFWTTGDDLCPGNQALWDMTMGLQWIQDNITAFNGDPSNVTIMGQSAGGASVDLLSLSPKSRDLFHKVIAMAGNANCEWAIHKNAVEECRRMAASNGITGSFDSKKARICHEKFEWFKVNLFQFLSDLRTLPAEKFATMMNLEVEDGEPTCVIGPRIDGIFLPKEVSEMRKEAKGKPRLIGSCHSEGLLLVAAGPPASISRIEEIIALMIPEKDYPLTCKQLRTAILNKVIDVTKDNDSDTVKRALGEIYSDMFTDIGVQRSVLECLKSSETPIFLYSFDFYNPKSWGLLGHRLPYKDATHCTEISYIFGVGALANFEFTADDLRVLDITTKLWTNFAKYGDPNNCGSDISPPCPSFRWEPATKENPQKHLSITLEPKMHETFKNGRPLLFAKMRMRNTSTNTVAIDSVSALSVLDF